METITMTSTSNKRKRGRPAKAERPALVEVEKPIEEQVLDSIEDVTVDDIVPVESEDLVLNEEMVQRMETRGRMSQEEIDIELSNTQNQKSEMQVMAGHMLRHFRDQVKNKQLDFEQELKLFKLISPYLGYENEGNKNHEDTGMDAFCMTYLEISARVQKVAEKSSPISRYK